MSYVFVAHSVMFTHKDGCQTEKLPFSSTGSKSPSLEHPPRVKAKVSRPTAPRHPSSKERGPVQWETSPCCGTRFPAFRHWKRHLCVCAQPFREPPLRPLMEWSRLVRQTNGSLDRMFCCWLSKPQCPFVGREPTKRADLEGELNSLPSCASLPGWQAFQRRCDGSFGTPVPSDQRQMCANDAGGAGDATTSVIFGALAWQLSSAEEPPRTPQSTKLLMPP